MAVACQVCELHAESVFKIEGMDCHEEVAILEKRLGKLPGLEGISADVLQQRLTITYDAAKLNTSVIAEAVAQTGMRAWLEHEQPIGPAPSAATRRLFVVLSGVLVCAGMALEFAGVDRRAVIGAYGLAIASGGFYSVRRALHAARSLALDINVLMLVAVAGAMVLGEWGEGASVVFLFALAQLLEARAMDRARGAISALMDLAPADALVRDAASGELRKLAVDAIAIGDIVVVRPGEKIPLDGCVTAGESHVNQAPVTGESLPVEKRPDDDVYAGTINGRGSLDVRVTRLRGDSTLARIIELVERAQAQRAPSQTFVERFARIYTPAVLAIAALDRRRAAAVDGRGVGRLDLPIAGAAGDFVSVRARDFDPRLGRVGACRRGAEGCADQGRRAPRAARRRAMHRVRQDRNAHEGGICASWTWRRSNGVPAERILQLAASLETLSEHPIGAAIVAHARDQRVPLTTVENFQALPGLGAEARVDGAPRRARQSSALRRARSLLAGHPRDARPRCRRGGQTMVIVGSDASDRDHRRGRSPARVRARCGADAARSWRSPRRAADRRPRRPPPTP